MLCAVRLPLEDKRRIVSDTSPHIHVFHISVIWRQALNPKHFTGIVDNTDIVQAKDIKLDVHQVVQLFHVNHGYRILGCRDTAQTNCLVNRQVTDKDSTRVCTDGDNCSINDVYIFEDLWILLSDSILMELHFFANVVCHMEIVHICAVFIESSANIADSALERDGIKGNNFC